jgi:2-(1,2-epoxy-1,2-dihydrophenyl)acetyl-CoA isomerase
MPTKGLGLTKSLLNASLTNTLQEHLSLESKYQIEAAQTKDYSEGVNAFVEKRKPNFIGK